MRLSTLARAGSALCALSLLGLVVAGPATGRWRLLPILSGSMSPGLPTGALALAMPEPADSLRRGQVLVYQAPDASRRLIAHRVVTVSPARGGIVVRTRGDANNAADPWHAELRSRTVWIVRSNVPYVGYLAVDARRFAPLLGLVAAVLGLSGTALVRVWRTPATSHAPSLTL